MAGKRRGRLPDFVDVNLSIVVDVVVVDRLQAVQHWNADRRLCEIWGTSQTPSEKKTVRGGEWLIVMSLSLTLRHL